MPVKAATGYAQVLGQPRDTNRIDTFCDENIERFQQPVDTLQLLAFRTRDPAIGNFFEQVGVRHR